MDANTESIGLTAAELDEARRYPIHVAWSAEDDAWLAAAPDLPGLLTHGTTVADAVEMADEAIAVWVSGLRHVGQAVPGPTATEPRVRVLPQPAATSVWVRTIRQRSGLSQRAFAAALNVSLGTVRSWEHGAREPGGPSLRLLELAERHPDIVFAPPRVGRAGPSEGAAAD